MIVMSSGGLNILFLQKPNIFLLLAADAVQMDAALIDKVNLSTILKSTAYDR